MLPSQNIDVAFRSSLVLTDDGQVYSGLIKQNDVSLIVLIDSKGLENRIPKHRISEIKELPTSPMPSRLHDVVGDNTQDLLAYLLSLTK